MAFQSIIIAYNIIFKSQYLFNTLFNPVGKDGSVDFGNVDFLGKVGGEGGGAELLL